MGGLSDDHSALVPKIAKMFVGQDGPSIYREAMEVGNPMKEGLSACFFFFLRSPDQYSQKVS